MLIVKRGLRNLKREDVVTDHSERIWELLKTRKGIGEAVVIAKAEIAEHAGAGTAAGLYSSALFNLLLNTLDRVENLESANVAARHRADFAERALDRSLVASRSL